MPATFVELASVTLTSAAASIEFTSISASYSHLVIIMSGRSDETVERSKQVQITFNGSTSADYGRQQFYATNLLAADETWNLTVMYSGSAVAAAGAPTNTFGAFRMIIPMYQDAFPKSTYNDAMVVAGNSTNAPWFSANGGIRNNTAAITSIKLRMDASPQVFVANSSAYLYGLKNS